MSNLPQSGIIASKGMKQSDTMTSSIPLGKEVENVPSLEHSVKDLQKELELPKEIAAVGVKAQPTVVHLPNSVSQMGVKSIGVNTQVGSGNSVSLPLTQSQIAEGFEKDIEFSWRWLAVWCIRKLKRFRMFQMNT